MSRESRFAAIADEIVKAEKKLGSDGEPLLVRPSDSTKDILSMPLKVIREKYKERYRAFKKLVRSGEKGISEEEQEEMRNWLQALNSLDKYIENHRTEGSELRDRQATVFEDVRDFIEKGGKDGFMKLPTGIGKTVLFTKLIESLNVKTLVVVPTIGLVHQTQDRIKEFGEEIDTGAVYGKAKEYDRDVTIITYASLVRQIEEGKLNPNDYYCLILDECQEGESDRRKAAIDQFEHITLRFSATPIETQEYSEEIHSMTIREGVEEGLLASVKNYVARTEVDLSDVRVKGSGEYDDEDLQKAVNLESRNEATVKLYQQLGEQKQALVFCAGVAHAQDMAEKFTSEGVSAMAIWGDMQGGSDEIERIKAAHAKKEFQVLCSDKLIVTGHDDPFIEVVINAKPIMTSEKDVIQRAGRGLRLDPDNPDKQAKIIDIVDSHAEETGRVPIVFGEVIDAAELNATPRSRSSQNVSGPPEPPVRIEIEGLKIYTEPREILELIQKNKKERSGVKEKTEFLSYQNLQTEVRKAGIQSLRSYQKKYKKQDGWPFDPQRVYKSSGWTNWPEFLGTGFLPLHDLQAEVRKARIKSSIEYRNEQKNHVNWPSDPNATYKDSGWTNWPEFLGTGFLSLRNLQEKVRRTKIKSRRQYKEEQKKHDDWPSNPNTTYKDSGWTNWDDFLGKS
jgi:superfamily II DNA or RNA helicase